MIPKPSSCDGCVFRHHGDYFTPDVIVPGSKVMFIAQNSGANEERGQLLTKRHFHGGSEYTDEYTEVQPQPLIGATGQQFNNRFLPLAQLQRSEISIGNAIRCRPGMSLGLKKPDDLPVITTKMRLEHSSADIVNALKHCRDAHLHIPDSVTTIVAMGRYAMFQLTGIQNEESEYSKKQGVVESWRGYAVDIPTTNSWNTVDTSYYHPLLPDNRHVYFMMHLAALNYGSNKRFMHATLQDFAKLRLLLDNKWPMALPTWSSTQPTVWPSYAAFDTEYIPDANILLRWSLCDTDNNLYCVESDDTMSNNITIQPRSTVLIQNALADIAHLSTLVDISMVNIEDMMLAHSVLWTGEPHNLNYINSVYGSLNRYKHLSSDNPQLYSALDAHQPMYMWQHYFLPAFKADPLSWRVYKKYRLPLINIINKAQLNGVKVDTSKLTEVQLILQERIARYKQEAVELTGDPLFKLSGRKQVMEYIYD